MPDVDRVAAEVALEVQLEGQPFSVIMRTPGDDRALAAGFLFSESVIRSRADVERIESESPNVVNAVLSRDRAAIVPDVLGQRRQVVMNSSCGMCGRRTLESLEVDREPLNPRWSVRADIILSLPTILRPSQQAFDATGGLHAAGLFDREGRLELSAEDVGRHNAVDKLVGRMLLTDRLPLGDSLLSLPTSHIPSEGTWEVKFTHRFNQSLDQGSFRDRIHSLYGLDSNADVGIGLSSAIRRRSC